MHTGAAIGRAAAELSPIVGGFNGAYGAYKSVDAISHEKLTAGQRLKSAGGGCWQLRRWFSKLGANS